MASRDISGRQLKFLSRSYSIPTSTNVDEVDVGDVGISGDVGVAIGDVVAAGDAASANAIAINQQVGEPDRFHNSGIYFCLTLMTNPLFSIFNSVILAAANIGNEEASQAYNFNDQVVTAINEGLETGAPGAPGATGAAGAAGATGAPGAPGATGADGVTEALSVRNGEIVDTVCELDSSFPQRFDVTVGWDAPPEIPGYTLQGYQLTCTFVSGDTGDDNAGADGDAANIVTVETDNTAATCSGPIVDTMDGDSTEYEVITSSILVSAIYTDSEGNEVLATSEIAGGGPSCGGAI